jgi:hypothetical protein
MEQESKSMTGQKTETRLNPDQANDLLKNLWPGSPSSRANELSISLTWSYPLTQLFDASLDTVEQLQAALHQTAVEVAEEAIKTQQANLRALAVADDYKGPHTEAVFSTFIDLAQIPQAVLLNLISDGVLVLIAAAVRAGASRVHREVGPQTLTVDTELSPRYLALLALSHAVSVYGVRPTITPTWEVLLDNDPVFVQDSYGNPFNYLVTTVDRGHHFVYQVARDGQVTQHTVDGLAQTPPRIDGSEDPDESWKAPSDLQKENGIIVSLSLDVDVRDVPEIRWRSYTDYRRLLLGDDLAYVLEQVIRDRPELTTAAIPAVKLQDQPPRADGLFPTIFSDVGPVIEYVWNAAPRFLAETIIGEVLVAVAKGTVVRLRQQGLPDHAVQVGFNRVALEALCVAYVRRRYHPRARVDVFTIPFNRHFEGYDFPVDPGLPVGWCVTVSTSTASYAFVVDGTMRAHLLTIKKRGQIEELHDINLGDLN